MKNKSNHIELVQRYLNNELTAQERDAFEKELKHNNLLREELYMQRKIDLFIQDDDLENFKFELDYVYDNLIKKRKKKRYLSVGRMAFAAASILLLISLSVVFLMNDNNVSGDKIFNEYYEGYPSSYITRSVEPCIKNNLYASALAQYEAKDYVSAKESFIAVSKNHLNNIAARFYLGIVNVELGDYNSAIEYFNKVIKSKDQFYVEQSEWYKVLCLVKLNHKSHAITHLNAIVEQKGFYRSRAEEILLKLE